MTHDQSFDLPEPYDEQPVALLVPGWKHRKTGRLHIRRDCRAVMYYAQQMSPCLVRFDYTDARELQRILAGTTDGPCKWCFPG